MAKSFSVFVLLIFGFGLYLVLLGILNISPSLNPSSIPPLVNQVSFSVTTETEKIVQRRSLVAPLIISGLFLLSVPVICFKAGTERRPKIGPLPLSEAHKYQQHESSSESDVEADYENDVNYVYDEDSFNLLIQNQLPTSFGRADKGKGTVRVKKEVDVQVDKNKSGVVLGFFEKYTKKIGRKIMEKYWWRGGGLGKKEQGIIEPIVVKRREDYAGLGNETIGKELVVPLEKNFVRAMSLEKNFVRATMDYAEEGEHISENRKPPNRPRDDDLS